MKPGELFSWVVFTILAVVVVIVVVAIVLIIAGWIR